MIPTVDVPQANTLGLVVDLVALLSLGIDGKKVLAKELRIALREVDYYKHAARILGFTADPIDKPVLRRTGRELMQAVRPGERDKIIARAIQETRIFKRLLSNFRPEELNKSTVVDFLKKSTVLTGTTLGRRADTILAWLKFFSTFDPLDVASVARFASKQAAKSYRAYRGGSEGPLHKKLKLAVAEAPEKYLGEPLRLVQVEYPFPTNDRADILFVDSREHLVAVEIKVDVGPMDVPGLLQALKYKHMLAVLFSVRPSAVRGILVARKIHPEIKGKAQRYGIETREVKKVI